MIILKGLLYLVYDIRREVILPLLPFSFCKKQSARKTKLLEAEAENDVPWCLNPIIIILLGSGPCNNNNA